MSGEELVCTDGKAINDNDQYLLHIMAKEKMGKNGAKGKKQTEAVPNLNCNLI